MRRTLMPMLTGSLALTAVALLPRLSHAHIDLNAPAPRHGGPNDQKTSPCGARNTARSNNVTVFAPGETITVEWDETVDHPGHYRIMFDDDGHDFPEPANERDFCVPGEDPGCLADNITDRRGGGAYSVQVTLPNIECENCTLQLIQVMTDRNPATLYYRCADLALRAPASGASSAASSGTGVDAASGTGAGGEGAAGSGGASATGAGGASTATSVAASSGAGLDAASGTSTGSASGAGTTGAGQGVGGDAPSSGEGSDSSDDGGGCNFGGAASGPIPAALGALALLSLAARGRRSAPRSRP